MLRLLGPNCVGMLVPGIGLNASFAHTNALPGKIAFVSQSGALVTGVLDWANSRGIGFSKFISLGDSADIDFGDLLDYLASDPATSAILLYVEDVRHARKFMSAARPRGSKPTMVLKAGRVAEGARGSLPHGCAGVSSGRRVRRGHPAQPACCACSPPKTCSRRSKRWPARGPCSASGWRS
ncbi:hypothetical protein LP419_02570 [Massilia sp. H-1]|nr:hypothetical protein LP419_02570 [Massilia sp. H-1]